MVWIWGLNKSAAHHGHATKAAMGQPRRGPPDRAERAKAEKLKFAEEPGLRTRQPKPT